MNTMAIIIVDGKLFDEETGEVIYDIDTLLRAEITVNRETNLPEFVDKDDVIQQLIDEGNCYIKSDIDYYDRLSKVLDKIRFESNCRCSLIFDN